MSESPPARSPAAASPAAASPAEPLAAQPGAERPAAVLAYQLVLERVAGLAEALTEEDRQHAQRVGQLARELAARPRVAGKLLPQSTDLDLKRELGRHSELLGRRSSKALPAASLARAVLADLGGDLRSQQALCSDCDQKLQLLGY